MLDFANELNQIYGRLEMKGVQMLNGLHHQIFDPKLGYYSGHYRRTEDGGFAMDRFPIPVVEVPGYCDVEIRLDRVVVSAKLRREDALNRSYEILLPYRFEAYGVEGYLDDLYRPGMLLTSEEEAVSAVGSVDEIAAQIVADIPTAKLVKEKIKPKKRRSAWENVLLVLGSPVWLSLLIAAFAGIFSLYISLWAVMFSLWAVFASLIGCALGGIVAGIGFAIGGNGLTGVALISSGVVCAGLSVFAFFGCKAATRGTVWLTKKIAIGVKTCFRKKEEA